MVEAILDGNLLLEECSTKTMLKMAQLGLRCTAWQPKDRPTMSQVAKELEEAMQQAQSVRRPTSSDESQSVSIDGVGLQRFYVEGCDDLSISSTNFTCFDASSRSSGDCKNKLSGISEEHL
ncbi:hypothetical protein HPP92_001747 [Vanilla planifolia]|uniref:Uncharacterized protein n=1 Tax=Vanilla planifolia TaxID=51239 RepID=A0A835RYT3_VANPL|nr:hypothetical protein HPP92_001747 [Vanilla planifolia]